MKIRERQLVGIAGIRRGPAALGLPQRLELLAQAVAQLSEKTQRLVQVAQFIHQVSLGQIGKTLVAHLRAAREPFAQCAPANRSDFIDAASRAPPGGRLVAAEPAFFLQALKRGLDLAQFSGPEVPDALIENGFQVVAAGGLAQQAQENVIQTHEHNMQHFI